MGCERTPVAPWGVELAEVVPFHRKKRRQEGRKERIGYPKVNSTAQPTCGSIPNLSDNLFYKTLRKKDIKINGKRVNQNVTIHENDEIIVYIADNLLEKKFDLNIIYEDDNILIIDKPINIEVTGTESLTSIIHKKYSECEYLPMPCHRLDRNTT